jgi:uracil-DNA glycosylase family 4
MPRFVPDEGVGSERVVLIGEAPGLHEDLTGRPFVGPAGQLLARWQAEAGLYREDCYWTNTYPYKPPGNKLNKVPKAEREHWIGELHQRLDALTDPYVLVPMGDFALKALVGTMGIVARRGALGQYTTRSGRVVKVIPTIHPAAIFRTPKWERRCRLDWHRIAGDARTREFDLPERQHLIAPTVQDLQDYVALVQAEPAGGVLAIDIETPRQLSWVSPGVKKDGTPKKAKRKKGARRIACVGFALTPRLSLTIPTTLGYWQDPHLLQQAWAVVKRLCEAPIEKVLHNGLFDTWWLARHGITLRSWLWDTLSLHHALDARDQHSLAYIASVLTRQPYWKDMDDPKEGDDDVGAVEDDDSPDARAFWRYNGIDACVTRELLDTLLGQVEKQGKLDFYRRHYGMMFAPLLRMMRRGLRVDDQVRRRRHMQLQGQLVRTLDELEGLVGEPLAGKKGALSAKRVQWLLYTHLRLPARKDRKTGNLTAKEVVVRQLTLRYPEKMGVIGPLVLRHQRLRKLAEFYDHKAVDQDGRVRCTYAFTTSTGRLSSRENPNGTGRNLQNVDREARDTFLPDEGRLFLAADLSQAESRVVWALTQDAELIQLARLGPWEFDVHTYNGTFIFGVREQAITKMQRYLAKRAVHAGHYGMEGLKLSEILLLDDVVQGVEVCTGMIEAYMQRFPAIRRWQRRVRAQVMEARRLVNPWGREWLGPSDRLTDELYREAYAFLPQSSIADLLNQHGLVPLDAEIRRRGWQSRVNAQVHDELLVSVVQEEAYDVALALQQHLAVEVVYRMHEGDEGVPLTIPVEWKLGRSWKAEVEWKRLPPRSEFDQAVRAMVAS